MATSRSYQLVPIRSVNITLLKCDDYLSRLQQFQGLLINKVAVYNLGAQGISQWFFEGQPYIADPCQVTGLLWHRTTDRWANKSLRVAAKSVFTTWERLQ